MTLSEEMKKIWKKDGLDAYQRSAAELGLRPFTVKEASTVSNNHEGDCE